MDNSNFGYAARAGGVLNLDFAYSDAGSTAIANGMQKVKEYPDPKNTISYAYAITRKEWQKMKEEEQNV